MSCVHQQTRTRLISLKRTDDCRGGKDAERGDRLYRPSAALVRPFRASTRGTARRCRGSLRAYLPRRAASFHCGGAEPARLQLIFPLPLSYISESILPISDLLSYQWSSPQQQSPMRYTSARHRFVAAASAVWAPIAWSGPRRCLRPLRVPPRPRARLPTQERCYTDFHGLSAQIAQRPAPGRSQPDPGFRPGPVAGAPDSVRSSGTIESKVSIRVIRALNP